MIRGSAIGSRPDLDLGVAMIVAGVGTVVVVLVWSAGLTRSSVGWDPAAVSVPEIALPGPRWHCTGCGRIGAGRGGTCPTCGRPLIRTITRQAATS